MKNQNKYNQTLVNSYDECYDICDKDDSIQEEGKVEGLSVSEKEKGGGRC